MKCYKKRSKRAQNLDVQRRRGSNNEIIWRWDGSVHWFLKPVRSPADASATLYPILFKNFRQPIFAQCYLCGVVRHRKEVCTFEISW